MNQAARVEGGLLSSPRLCGKKSWAGGDPAQSKMAIYRILPTTSMKDSINLAVNRIPR